MPIVSEIACRYSALSCRVWPKILSIQGYVQVPKTFIFKTKVVFSHYKLVIQRIEILFLDKLFLVSNLMTYYRNSVLLSYRKWRRTRAMIKNSAIFRIQHTTYIARIIGQCRIFQPSEEKKTLKTCVSR